MTWEEHTAVPAGQSMGCSQGSEELQNGNSGTGLGASLSRLASEKVGERSTMRRTCLSLFAATLCCGITYGDERAKPVTPVPDKAPAVLFVGAQITVDNDLVSGVTSFVFGEGVVVTTHTVGDNTLLRAGEGATHDVLLKGADGVRFALNPDTGATEASDPDPNGDCWACQSFPEFEASIQLLGCFETCSECDCEECIQIPCPPGDSGGSPGLPRGGGYLLDIWDGQFYHISSPAIGMLPRDENVTVMNPDREPVATFSGVDLELVLTAKDILPVPDSITAATVLGVERLTLHNTAATLIATEMFGVVEHFAYTTNGDAEVLISQPVGWQAPLIESGRNDATISMAPLSSDPPGPQGMSIPGGNTFEEIMADRCRACSFSPNKEVSLVVWDCVPGGSGCYKCVGWEC